MTNVIATIGSVFVRQEDDRRTWWKSGAAVDGDGANGQTIINGIPQFCYTPDDTGLDYLANAGYPHLGWEDILVADDHHKPLQINVGCLIGYCSMTAYAHDDKNLALNERWLDSVSVPYVVVNPIVRQKARGVVLGCKCRVTWHGRTIDAVAGDISGARRIGELSYAAAKALGFLNCSPRNGGVDKDVLFELFPNVPAVVNGETSKLIPA